MSKAITVYDEEDFPCVEWEHQDKDEEPCPMLEKWHEGEVRMCGKCGWKIAYNCEEEDQP